MQTIFRRKLLDDDIVNSFLNQFAENSSEYQTIYAAIFSTPKVVQCMHADISNTEADLIVVAIFQHGHTETIQIATRLSSVFHWD